MGPSPLSPLCITRLRFDGTTLLLTAAGETADGACPGCGERSRRVHANYQRFPLDLPWRGLQVRLALLVRRFRCDNEGCHRQTFAEDFGAVVGRRRRFTMVVQAVLREVAMAVGGRAGARLAERQGTPAGRATLLRLLDNNVAECSATPRVLGVDDLA